MKELRQVGAHDNARRVGRHEGEVNAFGGQDRRIATCERRDATRHRSRACQHQALLAANGLAEVMRIELDSLEHEPDNEGPFDVEGRN